MTQPQNVIFKEPVGKGGMVDKCSENGCEHPSVGGYTVCGKHLGYGQDNHDEEDPEFCANHPNMYACENYTVCGYCLGWGESCFDDPDYDTPAVELRKALDKNAAA